MKRDCLIYHDQETNEVLLGLLTFIFYHFCWGSGGSIVKSVLNYNSITDTQYYEDV